MRLWVVQILLACQGWIGWALHFVADPLDIYPGLTSYLMMKCSPRFNVVGFAELHGMQIAKVDSVTGHVIPVASVVLGQLGSRQNGTVTKLEHQDWLTKGEVKGFLDKVGTAHSYIQVNVGEPKDSDAGHYICLASGFNDDGLLVTLEESVNITASDIAEDEKALKMSVLTLIQKVGDLEKDRDSTRDRLLALEANYTNLANQLETMERNNQWQFSAINDSISARNATVPVNLLPPAGQTSVVFSVQQTHPVLNSGSVLYDAVGVNQDTVYNFTTGEFLPPLDGVYLLMASTTPYTNNSTAPSLSILRNGFSMIGQVVSTSVSGQGFTAIILPLQVGDRISTQEVYPSGFGGNVADKGGICTFSGFLIYPRSSPSITQ